MEPAAAAQGTQSAEAPSVPLSKEILEQVTEMSGYEISLLFLLFLAITLGWELVVGCLVFVNDLLGGRKSLWLERTKEELLGLGVVSWSVITVAITYRAEP